MCVLCTQIRKSLRALLVCLPEKRQNENNHIFILTSRVKWLIERQRYHEIRANSLWICVCLHILDTQTYTLYTKPSLMWWAFEKYTIVYDNNMSLSMRNKGIYVGYSVCESEYEMECCTNEIEHKTSTHIATKISTKAILKHTSSNIYYIICMYALCINLFINYIEAKMSQNT